MSQYQAEPSRTLCPICRGIGLHSDCVCPACQGQGQIIEPDASHRAREAILRARALRDAARRAIEDSRVLQNKIWTSFERYAASPSKAAEPVSLPLPELLHRAIEVTCADFGNIQLYDPLTRCLRIVTHNGFDTTFLDYFAEVTAGPGTSCGAAMRQNCRVVVLDVESDPIFCKTESGDVLLQSNVRSVQSTPIVTRAGTLVGVVSTHYRHASGPSRHALERLDKVIAEYAELLSSATGILRR